VNQKLLVIQGDLAITEVVQVATKSVVLTLIAKDVVDVVDLILG